MAMVDEFDYTCVNDDVYCECRLCKENKANGGDCTHCFTCINGERSASGCTDYNIKEDCLDMIKEQNESSKKQNPSNLKNVIMKEYKGDINLYLSMRTPLDMQRDAIRSFSDFEEGNIDLNFEGQVFLNSYFMQNALIACQTKYNQALVRSKSEEELLKHPEYGIPVNVIRKNLSNDQATLQAYSIIMNALNNICATGNLEYINVGIQDGNCLAYDQYTDYENIKED